MTKLLIVLDLMKIACNMEKIDNIIPYMKVQ